jgi:hypothetical protein
VLAILCILELRNIRPLLQDIRVILSALLERERIRSERKREPSRPPPSMGVPEDFASDEDTGLINIIEKQKRQAPKTNPLGIRVPKRGTHHDE